MTDPFEAAPQPPPEGSRDFLTDGMDALRSAALVPRFWTDAPRSEPGRAELVRGAELLQLHGPRARRGARIHGHQVLLSDILDSEHDVLADLQPRRSFKTSTLFAKAMGRIATREDYMIGYTMCTLAIKARQRFRDDIVKPLERTFPDLKSRPFRIVKAGGSERIEWIETGSVFAFLAPKGDAFRSDGWDWIILDEAGEATPEMGEDILEAAPETQDTRDGAHMTMAGTGPRYREGNLLWDALEKGRQKEHGYAIVDYSMEQDSTVADVNTWEKAERVLIDIHPTVGVVSNMNTIRRNYGLHGPAAFLREYGGVADIIGGRVGIVDQVRWSNGGLTTRKPASPPKQRFTFGIAVHPDQLSACIVAVWRTPTKVRILVIDHRPGVEWLVPRVLELGRRYRMPIAHDTIGPVSAETEALARARPRVKLYPQTFGNARTAAALLVKEIENGNVEHWDQTVLTNAARLVVKRASGSSWLLGRVDPEEDIIALEAASYALRVYDEAPVRPAIMPSEVA